MRTFGNLSHGSKLYSSILDNFGEDVYILISPWKGTGDVYYLCKYLPAFLKKKSITNYVWLVCGKSEASVIGLFDNCVDASRCLVYDGESLRNLLYYATFVDLIDKRVFCMHQVSPVHTSSICGYFAGRNGLSMERMTRDVILDLDSSCEVIFPNFKNDDTVDVFFEDNGLIPGKTVIVSPYSVSAMELSIDFWQEIVDILIDNGYTVCTNSVGPSEPVLKNTVPIFFKYAHAKCYLEKAGYFIGMRSGLCDIVDNVRCKKAYVYPSNPIYCLPDAVLEYIGFNEGDGSILQLQASDGNREMLQGAIISFILGDAWGENSNTFHNFDKISVIIPTHNSEHTICDTIDSILSQNVNVEVIVVDDHSSDSTCDVIAETYPFIKLIRLLKNGGAGNARNVGIDNASGKYVTFSDSDDIVPAGAYSKMLSCMKKSDSDLVIGSYEQIYSSGEKVLCTPCRSPTMYSALMSSGAVWDKLFKLSIIKKHNIRFPLPNNFEDNVFLAMYFQHAHNIQILEDVVYNYACRDDADGRLSQNLTNKIFLNAYENMRILYSLDLKCTDDEMFDAYIGAICWLIERWNKMNHANQLASYEVFKKIILLYDWGDRAFVFENLFGLQISEFTYCTYEKFRLINSVTISESKNVVLNRLYSGDLGWRFIIRSVIEKIRGMLR